MPVPSPAFWRASAIILLLFVVWDASGADMAFARVFGDASGFALRNNWLLDHVVHDAGRRLSWLLAIGLCIGVRWPVGPLRRLTFQGRLRLAASVLLSALVVSVIKGFSTTSCPWELSAFGGDTPYVPHWLPAKDGGRGHCFPAGHASSGFSFIGGFFAFASVDAKLARRWLAAALVAGVFFGLAQQVRGAHFMSHTLWTAWVCWCVAAAVHAHWRKPG